MSRQCSALLPMQRGWHVEFWGLDLKAAGQNFVPARPVTAIFVAVLALAAWSWRDLPGNWYEATQTDRRPFSRVSSWHYQLQNVDLDKLAAIDADVIVIDYARNGVPLTADEVRRVKVRAGKRPRIVLSYLAVGEAEEKRYYWDAAWTNEATRASWLKMPNCAWPGAWAVRYWEDGWKDIVYRGPDSYLSRIMAADFDGVYLDRVDMFGDYPGIAKERPTAARDMIDLVADLGARARAAKPGFIIVPNNGLPLLAYRRFRRAIDGLGMEELLYSEKVTGVRNNPRSIAENMSYLAKLQWDYKPVFTLEYMTDAAAIAAAKGELTAKGVIAAFPTRALDGGDPTVPADLHKDPGTPEFVAKNCTKENSW